jgi:Nucleotide modification associated domain 2
MWLCSYKLTHDTGFAPNPFFGRLTLATCKPRIRRAKGIGHWIAGFTSQVHGDRVGNERLIFLMQVTDRIDQHKYFRHPDFQEKIPNINAPDARDRAGDNISRPLRDDPQCPLDFEQINNPNHDRTDQCDDLSGRWVLVSSNFYYFGRGARQVPADLRPHVPPSQAPSGYWTKDETDNGCATRFVNWVQDFGQGVHAAPHQQWPDNDESWREGGGHN